MATVTMTTQLKFKNTPILIWKKTTITNKTTIWPFLSGRSLVRLAYQITNQIHPHWAPPVFSGVRVTRSLVLCVCLVDRCLSFFFWPLCCLSFFDLRILITSLWYLHTLITNEFGDRIMWVCQNVCCTSE